MILSAVCVYVQCSSYKLHPQEVVSVKFALISAVMDSNLLSETAGETPQAPAMQSSLKLQVTNYSCS